MTENVSDGAEESKSTTVECHGSSLVLPDDNECESSMVMRANFVRLENDGCESASSVYPTETLKLLDNNKYEPVPVLPSATLVEVDDTKSKDIASVYHNGALMQLDDNNSNAVEPFETIVQLDTCEGQSATPAYPIANLVELGETECADTTAEYPSVTLVHLDTYNCERVDFPYETLEQCDRKGRCECSSPLHSCANFAELDDSKIVTASPVYSTGTRLSYDYYKNESPPPGNPCETLQFDENQGVSEPHAYSGENPVELDDFNCESTSSRRVSSLHHTEILMKHDQKKFERETTPVQGDPPLQIDDNRFESEAPVLPRETVEQFDDYNSEDELTAINFPKTEMSLRRRRTRKLPYRPTAPTSKRFWGSRLKENLTSNEQGALAPIKPIPNQLPTEAYFIPISSIIL